MLRARNPLSPGYCPPRLQADAPCTACPAEPVAHSSRCTPCPAEVQMPDDRDQASDPMSSGMVSWQRRSVRGDAPAPRRPDPGLAVAHAPIHDVKYRPPNAGIRQDSGNWRDTNGYGTLDPSRQEGTLKKTAGGNCREAAASTQVTQGHTAVRLDAAMSRADHQGRLAAAARSAGRISRRGAMP
jgi:hypothetical protein